MFCFFWHPRDIFTGSENLEPINQDNTDRPVDEKEKDDETYVGVVPEHKIDPINEENEEESEKPVEEVIVKSESEPQSKSGWLNRFRNWVDDMFTDEYI